MPFGLCNATATFQRLMAPALTRVIEKNGNLSICCVDDVVKSTPTFQDHIDCLDKCLHEKGRTEVKSMEMPKLEGLNKTPWENGGQVWHQTRSRRS